MLLRSATPTEFAIGTAVVFSRHSSRHDLNCKCRYFCALMMFINPLSLVIVIILYCYRTIWSSLVGSVLFTLFYLSHVFHLVPMLLITAAYAPVIMTLLGVDESHRTVMITTEYKR